MFDGKIISTMNDSRLCGGARMASSFVCVELVRAVPTFGLSFQTGTMGPTSSICGLEVIYRVLVCAYY